MPLHQPVAHHAIDQPGDGGARHPRLIGQHVRRQAALVAFQQEQQDEAPFRQPLGSQRRRATPIDHCRQRQRLRTDAHAVLVSKILTFRFFQKGLIFGVKIDFHGLFLLRFGH